MKHRLAVLLLVGVAFSAMLQGAGTVTQTRRNVGNDTNIVVLTIDWTADASDGSVPFTYLDRDAFRDGYSIIQVQTKPGSTAPTANYDIVFADERGGDLMAAACINRSASATEYCTTDPHPVFGSVQFKLTNNSVNSATGTVIVTLTRNTVARRGGSGGGSATTVSNSGAGAALLKVGTDVTGRTITGTNVTVTENTDTIDIAVASGSANCAVTTSGSPPTATCTHNLALAAKENFVARCWTTGGTGETLGVDNLIPIDVNSLTVRTATATTVSCIIARGGGGGGGGAGDVTDVLAGTGIAVTNGGGPQPSIAVSLNSGAAQTCTGTDKVSALSAAGIVTCSADSGGGGSAPVWLSTTVADLDIASLTTACEAERTTTVAGATVGWPAVVAPPSDMLHNVTFPARVTAPNTVKWAACAIGTANPSIGTFIVYVIPPTV